MPWVVASLLPSWSRLVGFLLRSSNPYASAATRGTSRTKRGEDRGAAAVGVNHVKGWVLGSGWSGWGWFTPYHIARLRLTVTISISPVPPWGDWKEPNKVGEDGNGREESEERLDEETVTRGLYFSPFRLLLSSSTVPPFPSLGSFIAFRRETKEERKWRVSVPEGRGDMSDRSVTSVSDVNGLSLISLHVSLPGCAAMWQKRDMARLTPFVFPSYSPPKVPEVVRGKVDNVRDTKVEAVPRGFTWHYPPYERSVSHAIPSFQPPLATLTYCPSTSYILREGLERHAIA